jgi:HSP20 family protein
LWKDTWDFSNKIFEEMDKEFSEAEHLLNRMFRSVSETGTGPVFAQSVPLYYGYKIAVGPDGIPHVREFGNIKPSQKSLIEQSNARKPLVDSIFDEKENTLIITAEMPGITKQDIKVAVGNGLVTIQAEKGDKKYHSELPVKHELDEDSAKASYTNGILELKIKVKKPSKPSAKEIKIE